MIQKVSDPISNADDQIRNAAKALGKSNDRQEVFRQIYFGKKKIKTVGEISKLTGLDRKRVLTLGKQLSDQCVVIQTKKDNDTAYKKIDFLSAHKEKILILAGNTKKLDQLPSKVTPRPIGSQAGYIRIQIPKTLDRATLITVDEIDSFSEVRNRDFGIEEYKPISESWFKEGVRQILAEGDSFNDWGGERNDLITTRLKFKGKRRAAAFAFKGKGTSLKLTPASMGKNGDQIQRLFMSPAEIFFVQHWGQIDESVLEQMKTFAVVKSLYEAKEVFYGIINGQDTGRIIKAYPRAFK